MFYDFYVFFILGIFIYSEIIAQFDRLLTNARDTDVECIRGLQQVDLPLAILPRAIPEVPMPRAIPHVARVITRITNTESFVAASTAEHGCKFSYEISQYVDCKTPVRIGCNKHGIAFEQIPNEHAKPGIHCPECILDKCEIDRQSEEKEFHDARRKIHGERYQYDETEFISMTDKVSIRCRFHGIFYQTPKAHMDGFGCKPCGSRDKLSKMYMWLMVHYDVESILTNLNINIAGREYMFNFQIGKMLIIMDADQHLKMVMRPTHAHLRGQELEKMSSVCDAGYNIIRVHKTVVGKDDQGWTDQFLGYTSDIASADNHGRVYWIGDAAVYGGLRAAYTAHINKPKLLTA